MTANKARITHLVEELKFDTKRLIDEIRREGVDVSVPSNSVSKELAEKIRQKYFPKTESDVKRSVKVVKRRDRRVGASPGEDQRNMPQTSYDEIVDLFARTSPTEVMDFRPSVESQERVRYLLERNQDGDLTDSEAAELERFGELEHLMQLVKARAQTYLRRDA
jgi:hypothetical protein